MPPRPVVSVLDAIGNTPLVKLRHVVPPGAADVFVKLEYYNPTGSYKDRMALSMIEHAERRGDLRPGMRVIEYTGGSTGSSLAMVCAVKGYRFEPLSSDAFAREKLQTMRAFGASLTLLPSEGGTITVDLFDRFKAEIARQAAQPDTFYTDQFHNADAVSGCEAMGEELIAQLDGNITAFCAGVGTGSMLTGVTRALKAAGTGTRIIALEPAGSPVITTGRAAPHKVEGIGVGFWPPHLIRGDFDEARAIDDNAAQAMARRLAREEGVFTGTSSGLNIVAAVALAGELGAGATVVTVAVDSGLKYLAGGLYGE